MGGTSVHVTRIAGQVAGGDTPVASNRIATCKLMLLLPGFFDFLPFLIIKLLKIADGAPFA